jgi:hypothetical protein
MRKLSKSLSVLLATLLTFSVLATIIPAAGSSGNILVDTTVAPSAVYVLSIGGSVPLYFGGVTWSGGQVDLYLSTDGYATLTLPGDTKYGPTFSVAIITASAVDTTTYDGYSVGFNWINGTIPEDLEIAGGSYYVKAFDGATSAVAVTDNYIQIEATFTVAPAWGPGQAALILNGYALPANDYANLSYDTTTIQDLVPTDDLGRFTYNMAAPDLMEPGDLSQAGVFSELAEGIGWDNITFTMVVNSTGQTVDDYFQEYRRGLKQVKGDTEALSADDWLYGNGTDFFTPTGVPNVQVEVLGDLMITGKWFHPGSLEIFWDTTTAIGTTTANSTHGWFNVTVQAPITSLGNHSVTIDDGKCIFWFSVEVIPTLILDPDEGPAGTVVTARGYGFPASNSVLYNVTLDWDYVDACTMSGPINLGYVVTDGNGYFVTTFVVPGTVGGTHTVVAQANQTGDPEGTFTGTWADDEFTVEATLAISPMNFTNDGSIITVSGTGLDYTGWYNLCLDNKKDFYSANVMIDWGRIMLEMPPMEYWYEYESAVTSYFQPNCTGGVDFEFIAAGFEAGTHVVTIYKLPGGVSHQLPVIEDFVLFTVTGETPVLDKLDEIDEKLDDIKAAVEEIDFSAIGDDLEEIVDELGALGDIQTDITSVLSQLSDIKALSQTAATQATEASTSAGTAASSADAAETAAEAASAGVAGISTAVYGAIILSLIAALASIVAVITLQRKVA